MLSEFMLELMAYVMTLSGVITAIAMTLGNQHATYGRYADMSSLAKVGSHISEYVRRTAIMKNGKNWAMAK